MGKTSYCLKMLQILSSGRVYKGQELAEILETNVRNIAEYRTELEMAGYYIEGIPGKYGGYRLITQSVIPTVRLNEAEQRALSSGAEYLKSRNDFPYSSDYEKAIGKVFAAVKHEQPSGDATPCLTATDNPSQVLFCERCTAPPYHTVC